MLLQLLISSLVLTASLAPANAAVTSVVTKTVTRTTTATVGATVTKTQTTTSTVQVTATVTRTTKTAVPPPASTVTVTETETETDTLTQTVTASPPASTGCSAGQGFSNGNFVDASGSPTFVGWDIPYQVNSTAYADFDGASLDLYGAVLPFDNQEGGIVVITTQLALCPGVPYDITFQARQPYSGQSCTFQATLGSQVVQDTMAVPTTGGIWNNYGPYRVGPFNLDAQDDGDLYETFAVSTICQIGSSPVNVRYDSFSALPA